MPQLTFGYLYDFRNPPAWRKPWDQLYEETLEFAAWTETVGFEGAWVPEHHGAEDGYVPSPLVTLAALAARTKSLRLGPGIAQAPLYHPVRFAEDCAVLDVISGGRLDVGVALGYRRREAEAYGVNFAARGRRTDEFLAIVRKLWAGECVSFEGEHFTVKNASVQPLPLRGHIPLFIGGFTDKALERVAKHGDGYFGNVEVWDTYAEKLRAVGKDPARARVRLQGLFTVVADDPEQALHELAPHFHYMNNAYGEWLNEDRAATGFADKTLLQPMSLEAFKKSRILTILTPSQAIDMFRGLLGQAPVEHYTMAMPAGLPPSQLVKYAETFANKVIPAFRR
jgi:alkanesulfonate monooxygenase SsuD/methylene tetrahydromethanopterin reductase-like flavin-dependent oxidoreductase (luciferase family)